jgi:hypothetical protein
MENYQDKVAEFMRISGQLVATEPRQLTKEELDFRDTLLREEIRELQYAIVDNNRVEILDALCDIKYVNDGTANMMGFRKYDSHLQDKYNKYTFKVDTISDNLDFLNTVNVDSVNLIDMIVYELANSFRFHLENFKTALDRVHASNMSKFTYDIKTAEKTQQFYKDQGIDTYIEPKEKVTVVYREGDGKVLKGTDFYPPYLLDLV